MSNDPLVSNWTTVVIHGRAYRQIDILCPECRKSTMVLAPTQKIGAKSPVFYRCPEKKCFGVHFANRDGTPKGPPVKESTRRARQLCKQVIEDYCERRKVSPDQMSQLIYEQCGVRASIYQLDEGDCKRMIQFIRMSDVCE